MAVFSVDGPAEALGAGLAGGLAEVCGAPSAEGFAEGALGAVFADGPILNILAPAFVDGLAEALGDAFADRLARAPATRSVKELAEALAAGFAGGLAKLRGTLTEAVGAAPFPTGFDRDLSTTFGGRPTPTPASASEADKASAPAVSGSSSEGPASLSFLAGEPKILAVSPKMFMVLWRSR